MYVELAGNLSGTIQLLEGSRRLFILLVIIFVIIFVSLHLSLQSIVLPQACWDLFAINIISKEQDIQQQVLASM